MKIIKAKCSVCGREYETTKKNWMDSQRRHKNHCCSKECAIKLRKNGKNVSCACCGKTIYKSKKKLRQNNIYYCSIQCANKCINHSHKKTEGQKKKISQAIKRYCKTKEFQNHLQKRRSKSKTIFKKCPICNKEFYVQEWNEKRIYCSKECYINDHEQKFRKKTSGGLRPGSSRAYRGWYKGYYCDSSWELAYVIYNIEHEIKFERNKQGFKYEYNGQTHKFYPDFILEDGTYVEIKGYMSEQNKIKILNFQHSINVLDRNKIKFYLDYVENKYGKDFIKLYQLKK